MRLRLLVAVTGVRGTLRSVRTLTLAILIVLVAACSGDADDPASPLSSVTPTEVTSQWLEAVADGSSEALASLVEPVGLAVLAGVENSVSSAELAGLLEGGFDGELAAGYWSTFRGDFSAIRGGSLQSLTVGEESTIPGIDGYTTVAVSFEDAIGQVVLRQTDSSWQVDMVATVGPALIGPLGDYLESAMGGAHAAAIAAAYTSAVIPALDAAIALDGSNADLVFGTEYLRQLAAG